MRSLGEAHPAAAAEPVVSSGAAADPAAALRLSDAGAAARGHVRPLDGVGADLGPAELAQQVLADAGAEALQVPAFVHDADVPAVPDGLQRADNPAVAAEEPRDPGRTDAGDREEPA